MWALPHRRSLHAASGARHSFGNHRNQRGTQESTHSPVPVNPVLDEGIPLHRPSPGVIDVASLHANEIRAQDESAEGSPDRTAFCSENCCIYE